jgi:PIN domain nuclease of toxin-antitoxin system
VYVLVRYLLDTHIALWSLAADAQLPLAAREIIEDPEMTLVVSAASIWEIAIKHARNRGTARDMPLSGPQAVSAFSVSGYELLAISPQHAAAVGALPALHADPFDRLLVAQAMVDGLTLLASDATVASYSNAIRLV